MASKTETERAKEIAAMLDATEREKVLRATTRMQPFVLMAVLGYDRGDNLAPRRLGIGKKAHVPGYTSDVDEPTPLAKLVVKQLRGGPEAHRIHRGRLAR